MKRGAKSGAKTQTFDGYLAALSAEKRAALEKLRQAIRAAAPQAEECISYGVPAFRLNGKLLVALGAAANHCSFYPGSTLQAFKQDPQGIRHQQGHYPLSRGTILYRRRSCGSW